MEEGHVSRSRPAVPHFLCAACLRQTQAKPTLGGETGAWAAPCLALENEVSFRKKVTTTSAAMSPEILEPSFPWLLQPPTIAYGYPDKSPHLKNNCSIHLYGAGALEPVLEGQ